MLAGMFFYILPFEKIVYVSDLRNIFLACVWFRCVLHDSVALECRFLGVF